jgi:peptidoglycan/LPS O-acetylase OafA/YrhL
MSADATHKEAGEVVSLTALRGGLACWVVVYHFWNDVLALFPKAEVLSPLARRGHMAVPAFFMLSGFVLAYNYTSRFQVLSWRGLFDFLSRRLARVYPVHLATLLMVAVMVMVGGLLKFNLTDAGYTTRDFVLNLLLAQTWVPNFSLNWNYPSWSISSEWFAYLFFPLFVALSNFLGLIKPLRAAVFAILALVSSVGVVLFWSPWPFYELVLVVPTFLSGMAVSWAIRRLKPPTGVAARWSGVALICVMIGCCFSPSASATVALLLCSSLGVITSLGWSRDRCHSVWMLWPIVFLGEVSYSLYMTHTLAQKFVYKLLPSSRFTDADIPTRLAVLATYSVLIAVSCLLTYFAIEKPCRVLLRRQVRQSSATGKRVPLPLRSESHCPEPVQLVSRAHTRG